MFVKPYYYNINIEIVGYRDLALQLRNIIIYYTIYITQSAAGSFKNFGLKLYLLKMSNFQNTYY